MERSTGMKVGLVIAGILLVIVGLMIFRYPLETLVSFALFLGIAILVAGVMNIMAYFTNKEFLPSPGWLLAQGILDILIAILLLGNIGITTMSLPYIVGFWMLFTGIMRFVMAFSLKNAGFPKWGWQIVAAILYILLAVLILFHPAVGAAFIVAYIAVFMIFYGIGRAWEKCEKR